jgi:hypothetical protein
VAPSPPDAINRITFRTYRPQVLDGQAQSITTPIAYLTSLPSDPFADTKGAAFGYWNALDAGWIAWSYGPDTDERSANANGQNGQLQSYIWKIGNFADYATFVTQNSVYSPYTSNPTQTLRAGQDAIALQSFTYDPTNGSNSMGDVWRVKD